MLMTTKRLLNISLLMLLLMLGACAPADLDFTPTVTPTEAPTPTPTPDPLVAVETSANAALVDAIADSTPAMIPAGAVQWRRDTSREIEVVNNVPNGEARRVYVTEPGGGQANLTFGVFDTPEDAAAYFARFEEIRASLENGAENPDFPQPNLFGSGLYGSNAIFQMDNIFVEVSVEAFSSTAGNPLPPLARAAVDVVSTGLAEFDASTPDVAQAEAEAETVSANAAAVESIIAAVPGTIAAGAVQWRVDTSRDVQSPPNVTNGEARRIFLTEQGGGQAELTYGVFDTTEDAQGYYDSIEELRTSLENATPNTNFPEPNLFNTETYGSTAIILVDNIFIEANVLAFSSTLGDPLPGLMRAAINIMNDALGEEA